MKAFKWKATRVEAKFDRVTVFIERDRGSWFWSTDSGGHDRWLSPSGHAKTFPAAKRAAERAARAMLRKAGR